MTDTTTAIVRLLQSGSEYVSGERLSRELGISRTAIWKHISALRKNGYRIEAVTSRGYRLTAMPNVLAPHMICAALPGVTIGHSLDYRQNTASTNADAFRKAEDGAPDGTVVLADCQSGGKGRRGRCWTSPPGVNIYCSVVLRPAIMPHEAPQLTFISAVAVARAIEQVTGLEPKIKWPNDLLLSDKKVAGLLNEMSAETDGVNFVILGIGVNLNMSAEQFPADLRYPGTSLLLESGIPVDRNLFTAVLLKELDLLYSSFQKYGFDEIRIEWQLRCNAAGRNVVVSDAGMPDLEGRFAGIDPDGALLLMLESGVTQRITCGDVRVI